LVIRNPPSGYSLQRLLGSGSSASVYLGRDESLNRPVALKQISAAHLSRSDSQLLVDEGRTLASVANPHVAKVYDLVVETQTVWLVMEYVPGPSLQTILDEQKAIEIHRAIHWSAQLADALAALADLAMVHQDIKPANIIVSQHRQCRLVDFGLAISPQTARLSGGTPAFMSPEQIRGDHVGPASDVYSLGLVSHWILTGQHPFPAAAGDPEKMFAAQKETKPEPARKLRTDIPGGVSKVVAAALHKSPSKRPSAAEFRRRLIAGLG
jgi:serine/threonine protein kinase